MRKIFQKGYTLIELLITIGIIGLLLMIGVATFGNYERQNNLILTADSLKSFVVGARADAKSRDLNLWENDKITKVVLEITSDGLTINEYKYAGNVPYTDPGSTSPRVFRSFAVDKKINNLKDNGFKKIEIEVPSGEIISTLPLDISLNSSGDIVHLIVTKESVYVGEKTF